MSTFINYTYGRLSLDNAAHPRIMVGINPLAGLGLLNGSIAAGLRRKADAVDHTGFNKQDEDGYHRVAKRLKSADDGQGQIRQCLAKLSLGVASKRRVRPEGEAVRLRKRFLKSMCNSLPRSVSPESAPFAFTFTLVSLFEAVPSAMEDIEVPMSAAVSYRGRGPMLIDNPMDGHTEGPRGAMDDHTEGPRGALASVSVLDMDMDRTLELASVPDIVMCSLQDDERIDNALRVMMPVNTDVSIPCFLTQANVAREAVVGVVPCHSGTTVASSHNGPLALSEHLRGHLAPTPHEDIPTIDDDKVGSLASAKSPEEAYIPSSASFLRLVKPFITLDDDEYDTAISTTKDGVPHVLAETQEGSAEAEDAAIKLVENVAEESDTRPFAGCPGSALSARAVEEEDGEDVFGSVLLLPAPSFECSVKRASFQVADGSYDEEFSVHVFEDDQALYAHEENLFWGTSPSRFPVSTPLCSLDRLDSTNSSVHDADVDDVPLELVTDIATHDSSLWKLRDSLISFDLDEETGESERGSLFASSRLGSLVSFLDERTCEDSLFHASISHLDSLSSCDSEIWYDALDYSGESLDAPSSSLGNMQSAFDTVPNDTWAAALDGSVHSSLSTTETWIDLNSTSDSIPASMPGAFDAYTPLNALLETCCAWTSSVPTTSFLSADMSQLASEFPWGSVRDLDLAGFPTAPSEPFPAGPVDPLEELRRDVLMTCGAPPPSKTSFGFQLPEDDLPLWKLHDASSADLANLEVPGRTLPGAWRDSFDSVDDLFC